MMKLVHSENSICERFDRYLASPYYVLSLMLVTALGFAFSLEPVCYGLFTGICVYVCLFGADLLPLMPLVVFSYLMPSPRNNPGINENSVFTGGSGIFIACLGIVIAAVLCYRVFRDRKRFFRDKPPLLWGMAALWAAYLLGGIGTAGYGPRFPGNLLFAAVQGAAVAVPYLLLRNGVNWKNARWDYFAWIGFCAGGLVLFQVLYLYNGGNVIIDGIIRRQNLVTGWGMHNNLGGFLVMMIPFAFYLATKYRKGWIGTVAGSAFLIGVLMTCSRSSILAGVFIYLVCIYLMLAYSRNPKHNAIALVVVVCVLVLSVTLFHRQLLRLFSDVLGRGLDPSSRDIIYKNGLELFRQSPVLGNSFYSPGYQPWDFSTSESFSSLFPPRWHNTVIQLLVSCGAMGIVAYGFHRVQTVVLFLRRRHKEPVFIACALTVLLFTSLFDCHFFNIGPTLFYSMALAFGENIREVTHANH